MTAADRKVVWHDHGQWPQLSVFVPDAGRCVVLQKKTNFRPKLHSTSNPLPTSVLARASFNEPGCVSESCSSCSIFGQRLTIFLYFPKAMASTSRTTVAAAAGAAALLSGASFVSAPATTTSNLRASASAPSQAGHVGRVGHVCR